MVNNKIKNYVDVLFSDIPRTNKAIEMKEEILANLNDKFEDLIKEGKSETQAYSIAVSGMGDIDEMLNEIKPDEDFIVKAEKSTKKKAIADIVTMIFGVLAVISIILMGVVSELFSGTFLEDFIAVLGIIGFFVLAAIAAGIQIYIHTTMPKSHKDYYEMEHKKPQTNKEKKQFEGIMSIYWSIILLVYLLASFIFGIWHISWIIWPIAGVLSSIINTIHEMGQTDE